MKNCIRSYFIVIIVLGILVSCNSVNEPIKEKEFDPFLTEITEIEISMNAISPTFTILVNEAKFDLSTLNIVFLTSDTNTVDRSSIISSIVADSINFIIKPKIGKFGELQIKLVVSDGDIIDTTQFKVMVTFNEENNEYPTLLFPLSLGTIDSLRDKCPFNIDEYGFISYTGLLSRGQSNITNADSAVNLTKKTILQYSKFSNVFNQSSLLLNGASNYNPTSIPRSDWTITFKNQIYGGLEVIRTEILAIVHDEVVNLMGHHFNNIFIPNENLVPLERVKELLIGQKYEYECWVPMVLEITEESISTDISKKIFWRVIENHIEFRVIWSVPIIGNGFSFPSWYIYIDVISGEILAYVPTFIC